MKRILWTVRKALATSLDAGAAARAFDRAGRRIAKRPPPALPWWSGRGPSPQLRIAFDHPDTI